MAGYPQSGTTWMQQLVRLIRNNGVQDDVILSAAVQAISLYPGVNVDNMSRPRAFKSHMPYDLCPCGPPNTTPCRYIYVMRNPKDVAVSLFFQQKKSPFTLTRTGTLSGRSLSKEKWNMVTTLTTF